MNIPLQTSESRLAVDGERFRLRAFLAGLEGSAELKVVPGPHELAELGAMIEGEAKATLFRSVGPEGAELAANVCGSRERLARAFGVPADRLVREVAARLSNPAELVELPREAAPVQEIVLEGDDADLTALPVHLQHGFDGAPYISSAIDYVVDFRTGLTNVGIRRLMLRGRREAGVDLTAPSDLRNIYEANAAQGRPLPVAFVVGAHPIDHVAAMMRLPIDELGILASLRGTPLPVVKCVTSDIRVPADAEMVLEGYFDARGHVETEGPYGEFLGYYGVVKRNPVFHLSAITRRRDALFQTCTISGRTMSRTDTAQLAAIRTEVTLWRALENAVREPLAVHATFGSGGMLNVRIQLRQRVPGEARNAIAAAFGSVANVKTVFVVDPDIDIFSDEQIDWAMATRFQADRDLIVVEGLRALPLDPSLEGARTGAKAGFDLTWPFGKSGGLERQPPEPPTFQGERFPTLEAALEDGPKTFEQLMTALASRDGREIVRALEDLGARRPIARGEDGRLGFTD